MVEGKSRGEKGRLWAIRKLRARLTEMGLSLGKIAREQEWKEVTVKAAVYRYWGRPELEWPEKGTIFRDVLYHLVDITKGKKAKK